MMTTLVLFAVLVVLYRVMHIAAVVNLDPGASRHHLLGLAMHIATAAAGAVLCLVGVFAGNLPALVAAAWFLLLSIAALTFIDQRKRWP